MRKSTSKSKKASVKVTLSVGEKLRQARLKMNVDLLEAERSTLIRAKYLEAIEQSRYYQLPLPVYTLGFVQTYATFLGLNSKRILEQFQTEYGLASASSNAHIAVDNKLSPVRVMITPKLMWRAACVALIVLLVAYFGIQISSFAGVPSLTLESPAQSAEVKGDSVTVIGSTDPGVIVQIGGQSIPVAEDGRFVQSVRVEHGVNNIIVKAQNRLGKSREQSRIVLVNAPQAALNGSPERLNGQN